MSDEWLKALKVGDTVLYDVGVWSDFNATTVNRLTTTQIVTVGNVRYRRDTGRGCGAVRGGLYEANANNIRLMWLRGLRSNLGLTFGRNFINRLSLDQLKRIAAIVAEVKE